MPSTTSDPASGSPTGSPPRPPAAWWRARAAPFQLAGALALPPLLGYLAWRVGIQGKPLPGLRQKLTGSCAPLPPGRLMLHGVSLGETALMRPVIERLAERGERCLLTTSTTTGWQGLQRYADHDHRYLPFDLPWAVETFLSRTRPRALVLFDCELWPTLLLACYRRGIPVVIANARLTAHSFAGYRRAGALLRPVFAGLTAVLGQNRLWTDRFRALGVRRGLVVGSLKADVVTPADAATRDAEARRLGLPPGPPAAKHVLLGASTSAGEEAPILASWQQWRQAHPYRLVLCPRHPERGAELARLCREQGLAATRSSGLADGAAPPDDHVLIVDEIGRLGALYANARLAVVGGSLGSGRGGQNMLEAAAAGCCTVVGDDTRNQPDAMAVLRREAAVVETDTNELDRTLRDLITDEARQAELGSRARRAWSDSRGAADRLLAALTELGILAGRLGRPASWRP